MNRTSQLIIMLLPLYVVVLGDWNNRDPLNRETQYYSLISFALIALLVAIVSGWIGKRHGRIKRTSRKIEAT